MQRCCTLALACLLIVVVAAETHHSRLFFDKIDTDADGKWSFSEIRFVLSSLTRFNSVNTETLLVENFELCAMRTRNRKKRMRSNRYLLLDAFDHHNACRRCTV